jgi:catechol 2,3-dioxygenase-like lactoylglutathione lyase family enzyme
MRGGFAVGRGIPDFASLHPGYALRPGYALLRTKLHRNSVLTEKTNEEFGGKVAMPEVRLEGLTLRVASVKRSMEFYGGKLGFRVEIDKAPQFAMIRVGGPTGGTIGLLAHDSANPLGSISMTPEQRAGIHVELTTDDLDVLYEHLKARGVAFFEPPHEEPWERSMRAHDPDGYTVEFAEGRRGHRGVT